MTLKHKNKMILGAVLGNLIEAFDMAICGFLSAYLAKYLIGSINEGLMIIFITFFVGYMARPLGALFLGLFSDVYGRKITLSASIITMGFATACIGFIPSYQSIGIYAVMGLFILRILQSFSCGVEYLNSTAYLIENFDKKEKGFAGIWSSFGSTAGLLFATIVTLVMSWSIKNHPDLEWLIWRVPFMLALLGSSIGLYIRMYLPESLEFVIYYSEQPKPSIKKILNESLLYCMENQFKTIYVFILSCLGVTTTFLFYIYGPTQAHIDGHFTHNQIILSNSISLLILLGIYPFAGRLTDRISQNKMLIAALFGFSLLSYLFFSTQSSGNYLYFLGIQALISIPSGIYYATVPVMLTNMFPVNLRCTALSVIYSIAASLSAGLTPLLSLVLIQKTHSQTAPSLIVLILVCLTIGLLLFSSMRKRNLSIGFQIA